MSTEQEWNEMLEREAAKLNGRMIAVHTSELLGYLLSAGKITTAEEEILDLKTDGKSVFVTVPNRPSEADTTA